MPDETTTQDDLGPVGVLASDLRIALRPIFRRLIAERTTPLGHSGVLVRLEQHGPTTSAELAAHERITPQSMAAIVAELAARGLVVRTPDEADRRRRWVTLTDAGRAVLSAERGANHGWLVEALADRLTPAERRSVATALPALLKLTEDAPSAHSAH